MLPFLFAEHFCATMTKENNMRKPASFLIVLLFALGLSACTSRPVTGPSADEQRSRAHGAQDELSSEVHK